jgi:hypothetical protein
MKRCARLQGWVKEDGVLVLVVVGVYIVQ